MIFHVHKWDKGFISATEKLSLGDKRYILVHKTCLKCGKRKTVKE